MWPDKPRDINNDIDMTRARRIIQRELFFEIEAGSTRPPKDETVERKQWMDVVGVIKANFPGRLDDSVILPQLLKKFEFKDIEQAVIGFDEEEARVAQIENSLLQQGVPVPVSPNQNHKVHMAIHAQIIQGGQSTQQLEEHLLQHAQFDERNSPNVSPQSGDSGRKATSTTPELKRSGTPEQTDILAGAKTPISGTNQGELKT